MAKLQKGVNDLKTWCLNNGDFGLQLIKEWTGVCEDGKHYEIDEIAKDSPKKVKWKCNKGHEWYAAISNRTYRKSGCPYCSGSIVSDKSSLKTWCLNNDEFGKQLMQEWTGECEDGRRYEIDEISFGCKKKLKWKCDKGHVWTVGTNSRTAYKTGCSCCSNGKRSDKASQAKLQRGVNDLKTWCLANGDFGRQLMNEWTGECEDGKHYEIDEVARGSHKRFKWKCGKGHEWVTGANGRTVYKTGCKSCNATGTSYPEQFIFHCLNQIYHNTENRCRVLKSPQNPHGIEFDIGIPEIPLCIEYSATWCHEGRQEIDEYKKKICEKANVRLIQIVEDSYGELDHCTEDDYICFKMDSTMQDEILAYIVGHILKSLGHLISEINIELAKKNASEYSKGKIPYEESLKNTYPKLTEEWHPTLNGNLKPDEIKCGSNKKVYWQCPKCNHGSNGEWYTTVNQRAYYKSGCSVCGYNWSDDRIHKTGSVIVRKGVNDLQSQHPELAKEWHPALNSPTKPDE